MPAKRIWLFIAAAALLLWLRPWRRLARHLRQSPGPGDVPHPEAAFTTSGEADAEPLGAILDRNADLLAQTARDDASSRGLGAAKPAQQEADFAGPIFFGPGPIDDGEVDLVEALLAHDEAIDAETALKALSADIDDDEVDLVKALLAHDEALDAATALKALSADEAAALEAGPGEPVPAAADTALRYSDEPATLTAGPSDPDSAALTFADEPATLTAGPIDPDGAALAFAAADDSELLAEAVGAPSARPDDLLVIEGIGPRTSTIVTAAGFTSFAQLAEAAPEQLRAALADAGLRTVDPSTWPTQARLAADGRWDELRELQGRIKNGRIEA